MGTVQECDGGFLLGKGCAGNAVECATGRGADHRKTKLQVTRIVCSVTQWVGQWVGQIVFEQIVSDIGDGFCQCTKESEARYPSH
jgi:hypothetical protein